MDPMEGLKAGRIVYYVFDDEDIKEIAAFCAKTGSTCSPLKPGDIAPAMVVKVWQGTTINLKVMLDGTDTCWATSVVFDEKKSPRSWHWLFEGQSSRYKPDRVEKAEV